MESASIYLWQHKETENKKDPCLIQDHNTVTEQELKPRLARPSDKYLLALEMLI